MPPHRPSAPGSVNRAYNRFCHGYNQVRRVRHNGLSFVLKPETCGPDPAAEARLAVFEGGQRGDIDLGVCKNRRATLAKRQFARKTTKS
jgi:hypothetical protein